MVNYKIIDHTADLGIHVTGPDLRQLFIRAGLAMFDLIADARKLPIVKICRISVSGLDWPDLMASDAFQRLQMDNPRRAAHHTGLRQVFTRLNSTSDQYHTKRLATLDAVMDHPAIARLEDMQMDRRAGEKDRIQGEKWDFIHDMGILPHFAPNSSGV